MHERKRNVRSSRSSSKHGDSDGSEEEESNPFGESSDDQDARRPKGHRMPREKSYNDFKVDIPESEG